MPHIFQTNTYIGERKIIALPCIEDCLGTCTQGPTGGPNFAEDPQHQGHLEDEDGVEEPPVEREAEQGDPAAVVAQVRHCRAPQPKISLT